jgi:hypothetical protein
VAISNYKNIYVVSTDRNENFGKIMKDVEIDPKGVITAVDLNEKNVFIIAFNTRKSGPPAAILKHGTYDQKFLLVTFENLISEQRNKWVIEISKLQSTAVKLKWILPDRMGN